MRAPGRGGLARVPNLRVCQHPLGMWHTEGWTDILPWYRLVGVTKTSSETQRRKSRAARKGKWPARGTGTTFLTYPEVRTGNRQGWWKRSKFRWNGRQLSLEKTVGSRVWRHTQGSSGRSASDLGWRSSSKTAPGSLSTGSPASRTPPHGDGSMYRQVNIREESVLRPPPRALPSVIVDTEKVLREDGKVITPGAPRKPDVDEPVRSPKIISVPSWKHKLQRWRRNSSWQNGATRCKPWRIKSWANNAERGERGLPSLRATTFRCEACWGLTRSRTDSEN